MLAKLDALEAGAVDAGGQVDLLLYRAQLARVLELDLYLLEVESGRGVLHKIGVTSRGIEARLPEIRADLATHVGAVELRVQNVWRHRGCLELYFKQAFAKQRVELGPLTEYFALQGRKPFRWLGALEPWALPPRLKKLLDVDP